MKLRMKKNAKFAKVFTVLFTIAVMTSLCAVTAFATGGAGGSEAAYQSTITFFITWIRRVGWMIAFVGGIFAGVSFFLYQAMYLFLSLISSCCATATP